MKRTAGCFALSYVICTALLVPAPLWGLELEPGIYRNAPVGLNGVSVAYGYSAGNVLFDNSTVSVEDATSKIHTAAFGAARFWNVFGRTLRTDAIIPVAWAHFEGNVNGQFMTRDPQGLADPRFRFTLNLMGAPALSRSEFAQYKQKTIWALSLMFALPLGQYDSARVINLGANRFSFRPETGVSRVWGPWCVETAVGAWVFTPNHDFFHGQKLTQDPIPYWKGDFIYSFNRQAWLSLNYGLATGGRTSVDGVEQNTLQTNYQLGGTFSLALNRSDAVTLTYSKGLATRIGADFHSGTIAYAHTWGGRP